MHVRHSAALKARVATVEITRIKKNPIGIVLKVAAMEVVIKVIVASRLPDVNPYPIACEQQILVGHLCRGSELCVANAYTHGAVQKRKVAMHDTGLVLIL